MSDKKVQEIWTKACDHLQTLLHPDIYARWIAVIEPESLHERILTLRVDNNFYQTWLEDNYLPLIQKAIATACGLETTIRFHVAKTAARGEPEPPPRLVPEPRHKPFRVPAAAESGNSLNPNFTFENFIVGSSNSFAHAAAMAVAQAPARAYNPLFIYGGTGLGKTHLMQAIGHNVLQTSKPKVAYLSSEAFTNEYIDALQNRTLVAFRKKYRNMDLLLIDDIHFLAGKERMQEEFFHTFNALYDAHKQIVMNSDRPAAEIAGLEQRLVSRFEWGLVTELQAPDLETRIAILRNKKEKGKLPVSDAALSFIAQAVQSNIRRLEGALIRVASYASLKGRDLAQNELEDLLRDTLEQEKQETITFDMIMRAVAEHYDVRLADMTSKRRPQAIALPRQVAMYLCRQFTSASLPEIANVFCKTHATVFYACREIDKRMAANSELQSSVVQIKRQLQRS